MPCVLLKMLWISKMIWQVNPSDVILLEGILLFHDPRVRGLMNMKIFVDTGQSFISPLLWMKVWNLAIHNFTLTSFCADADVRLARRIKRDTSQNDRDIGTVLDQVSPGIPLSTALGFLHMTVSESRPFWCSTQSLWSLPLMTSFFQRRSMQTS